MPTFNFAQLREKVEKGVLRADFSDPDYGDFVNTALKEIQDRFSFLSMKKTVFVSINPGTMAAGGNMVGVGAMWPTGTGTLSFELSGFAIGARYYFNPGEGPGSASGISLDGVNPFNAKDGFFIATQANYFILADATVSSGQLISAAVIAAGLDQVAKLPPNFKELQKDQSIHYVTDDGQFIPAEVVNEWQQNFRIWAFGGTPFSTWPPRIYYDRRSDTESVIGIVEPLTFKFNFRVKGYFYLPDLVNDDDVSPIALQYPEMVIAKSKQVAFSRINDPAELQFETEYQGKLTAAIRHNDYAEIRGMDKRM